MQSRHRVVLHLLQGIRLSVDGTVRSVPEGARKLLAFVALHRRPARRCLVAGTLWPDVDESRAAGNLRSTLWRLRSCAPEVLAVEPSTLGLRPGVAVDVALLGERAARLVAGTATEDDLSVELDWLDGLDLFPGWYDDWALVERERVRQRTLAGVEALSARLCERRRFGEAVDAALLAVAADPLRESGQRALIAAHLAEGNVVEARRAFSRYELLLRAELGVETSSQMQALGLGGPPQGSRLTRVREPVMSGDR